MYAVIFKAKEKGLDSEYSKMAQKMRKLAPKSLLQNIKIHSSFTASKNCIFGL